MQNDLLKRLGVTKIVHYGPHGREAVGGKSRVSINEHDNKKR